MRVVAADFGKTRDARDNCSAQPADVAAAGVVPIVSQDPQHRGGRGEGGDLIKSNAAKAAKAVLIMH